MSNPGFYITKMFDRIDRLCDEVYGTANKGVTEFVIKSNPGIEQYGIVLPMGIKVLTPDLPEPIDTDPVVTQIHLWT